MQHFIKVYTVCKGKKDIQAKQTIFWGKYNLTPLDMYNALSQVYCIKPEGRIHYIQRVLIPVIYRPPFRILINLTIKKLLMILAMYHSSQSGRKLH